MHILLPITFGLVGGCAKAIAPAPAPDPEAPSEPSSREIVAGPRNIIEEEVPEVSPDVPGQGPRVAYLIALRKSLRGVFYRCIANTDATAEQRPALVKLRIDPEGQLLGSDLSHSSGHPGLDECALIATRNSALPKPPATLLNGDGHLETPDVAFLVEPE